MRAKRLLAQEEAAREAYLQRRKARAAVEVRARRARSEAAKYWLLRFGAPLAAGIVAGVLLTNQAGGNS